MEKAMSDERAGGGDCGEDLVMSETLPYPTIFRKTRRVMWLLVASRLLDWAEKSVPADMYSVKLAILEANVTTLNAIDFKTKLVSGPTGI